MQVLQKEKDGLRHVYEIKVPAKTISQQIDKKLQELGTKVNVPGFRPGKAPATLLKQKYGPSVMGEVVDITVRESYSKALEEKGLRAATQPKVEVKDFGEDKDLVFSFDVEVLPEIKIGDVSKLKLEKIKADVTDADVDQALKTLSERYRGTREVTDGRAAKEGDHVTLDFLGKVDGVAFAGGEGKDYRLSLGSGTFLPDFEAGVVGFKAGESRDIDVKFPENYGHQDLAGKTAQFTITAHKIEEDTEATIDDELAKRLGFASLDDLKEAAKSQISKEYDSVAREKTKRTLFDMLNDEYDFELPQSLVNGEYDAIWGQFSEAKKNNQIAEEDKDKSDEDMQAELRDVAERRVRLGLLLSEIGNQNKIDVSDDELRRAIMAEAQRYPGQEQRVLDFYRSTPQALMSLRGPLLEEKVIDFILESATVTTKPVSKEELFAPAESDGEGAKKSAKSKKGDGETKAKAKKAKKD